MSGGSYNYIYLSLSNECEGQMQDAEMNDLIKDLCVLLHDLEWWQSGDSSESKYKETLSKFKAKWLRGYTPSKYYEKPKMAQIWNNKTIDILGTAYTIKSQKRAENKQFSADEYMDGYTDYSIKEIVICDQESEDGCMEDLRVYEDQVLRHEIVHAFLFESGLHACSDWATNEEIVDWIAIQIPKISKAIKEVADD